MAERVVSQFKLLQRLAFACQLTEVRLAELDLSYLKLLEILGQTSEEIKKFIQDLVGTLKAFQLNLNDRLMVTKLE